MQAVTKQRRPKSKAIKYASAKRRMDEIAKVRAFQRRAVKIDSAVKMTTKAKMQADVVFEKIEQPGWYKIAAKQAYNRNLFFALAKARYLKGAVMYPRNPNHEDWSRSNQQVIDGFIAAGLANDYRAKPGGSKMSRHAGAGRGRRGWRSVDARCVQGSARGRQGTPHEY